METIIPELINMSKEDQRRQDMLFGALLVLLGAFAAFKLLKG